jgi:transposase-like protein
MGANHSQNNKNWRERNPEKHKAHIILNEAIRTKQIIKPKNCQKCDKEKPLQAHHEDYNKPLNVIWLCSSCHHKTHKLKRIESNSYKQKKVYIRKGYNNKGKSKPYKKPLYFDKAKELRNQGYSYSQIANKLDISKSQIYKWLNNTPYN